MTGHSREPAPLNRSQLPNPTARRQPWLPIALIIVGATIVAALLWPQQSDPEYPTPSPCRMVLRRIAQAMYMYAQVGDRFPDSLDALVRAGHVTDADLSCPDASRKGLPSAKYAYLGGLGVSDDRTLVVAYEQPTNHWGNGANMLFVDGHVDFVRPPRFQAELNRAQAYLARPASRANR